MMIIIIGYNFFTNTETLTWQAEILRCLCSSENRFIQGGQKPDCYFSTICNFCIMMTWKGDPYIRVQTVQLFFWREDWSCVTPPTAKS